MRCNGPRKREWSLPEALVLEFGCSCHTLCSSFKLPAALLRGSTTVEGAC